MMTRDYEWLSKGRYWVERCWIFREFYAWYHVALAPDTRCTEMGLQWTAQKSRATSCLSQEVNTRVLSTERENPKWGYDRIQGALANLGYHVSDQTVGNILKKHGIEPEPQRKRHTTWTTFIKAHWDVLSATDFTTIEVWTKGGLVTFSLLFVMELKTRRIHFAGCTPNPAESWMMQFANSLIIIITKEITKDWKTLSLNLVMK